MATSGLGSDPPSTLYGRPPPPARLGSSLVLVHVTTVAPATALPRPLPAHSHRALVMNGSSGWGATECSSPASLAVMPGGSTSVTVIVPLLAAAPMLKRLMSIVPRPLGRKCVGKAVAVSSHPVPEIPDDATADEASQVNAASIP